MRRIGTPVRLRAAPLLRKPLRIITEPLLRRRSVLVEIPAIAIEHLRLVAIMKDLAHTHRQIAVAFEQIGQELRLGSNIIGLADVLIVQLRIVSGAKRV